MRVRLALLAAVATVLVLVLGVGGPAVAAQGGCAGNGTAFNSPGLTMNGVKTVSLSVKARVTCVGTTSGAVTATGSLTGTCQALKGSATVSGALSGTIKITTEGPAFTLTGKLNGHPFNAAGAFAPKKGNCVTQPLTSASVVFSGAFLR